MIGQKVRDYEILEEIASGGYGAVYRAHEATVGRDVAIKVILPRHADKPEFKLRFEGEARLIAQLEHPHIVPLYTYWQDESGAFLVMRFIQGGSLRQLMYKQGALSLAQTTRILDQLADALSVAHDAEVVHRDLKPENILIDQRGNAYLTDFGIAKQINANAPHITETDAILGTVAYLSPEQIQAEGVSPKSDIYALGIMLFEMLAGSHPFAGAIATMLIVKHLQEPVPDIHHDRPQVPQAVNTVIQRATAKEAASRYISVLDMAAAFREAVQQPLGNVTLETPEPMAAPQPVKRSPIGDRNRYQMLESVRVYWVEGVLERSLHGMALIELGVREQIHHITRPWDKTLRIIGETDKELAPSTRIIEIFDNLNGKLLILGAPGSGKTTTMLDLARELLYRATQDNEHPIPAIFNLASWAYQQRPLAEWLVSELQNKYQVPQKIAVQWVENDALLLLLDGLDEVDLRYRDTCVEAINHYRNIHGFVDVVVCSRILDYEVLKDKLHLNGAVMLQPLTEAQVDSYLGDIGTNMTTLRNLLRRDSAIREMSASPLMLSMMILAYSDTSTQSLPEFDNQDEQRRYLFERYTSRMLERYETDSYNREQVVKYLHWFASRMLHERRTVFYIEEMQPSWLQKKWQFRIYRLISEFMNRLQDILRISVGIAFLAGFLVFISAPFLLDVLRALLGGMIIGLILGVIWWLFDALSIVQVADNHYGTVEGVTNRNSHTDWLTSPKSGYVALGESAGQFQAGSSVTTRFTIELADLKDEDEQEPTTIPNELVWRALRRAVQVFLLSAILLGIAYGVAFGSGWGIGFGLLAGFIITTATRSGEIVIQHALIRLMLYSTGAIPLNVARFLDYCTRLILLRKVGGGYIFIHRYLLEYFADLG